MLIFAMITHSPERPSLTAPEQVAEKRQTINFILK